MFREFSIVSPGVKQEYVEVVLSDAGTSVVTAETFWSLNAKKKKKIVYVSKKLLRTLVSQLLTQRKSSF